MQFPKDFLGKSERVREGPGIGWSRVQCKYSYESRAYRLCNVKLQKTISKDFRQAAMDTYSRTMHANKITTSWKLFCPVSYTMRAFLVFPPLSFSKGNSLGLGCMRDRANKANSANCCDQSYFPLYCYNGRYNLIIDHNITLLFM